MPIYVVWTVGGEKESDRKAFSRREDARSYATAQIADGADRSEIFEVDAPNAPAAIAALEMGNGRYIEGRHARTSEEALARREQAEWERAKASGDVKAMLKALGL